MDIINRRLYIIHRRLYIIRHRRYIINALRCMQSFATRMHLNAYLPLLFYAFEQFCKEFARESHNVRITATNLLDDSAVLNPIRTRLIHR